MSWYERHPINLETVLVRGRLANVERTEKKHDFITTTGQRFAYDAATVLGTAAGSAAAPGLVTMAGDRFEKSEWVSFKVSDKTFEGWLWELPFEEGDEVEVIARPGENETYEVLAVKRLEDGLVAVYPHVTSGRKAHFRRTIKFSLLFWIFCSIATLFIGFLSVGEKDFFFALPFMVFIYCTGGIVMFSFFAYRASRHFRPFVQIAEHVFNEFGWANVKSIDLRRSSKRLRRTDDPPRYGIMFFRYE